MLALTLRSDSDQANIALYQATTQLAEHSWEAGRKLSDELLAELSQLIEQHNYRWADIGGLVVCRGPGSFTALRIVATVANTVAYSLDIPVVGEIGDDWQAKGVQRLASGDNDGTGIPHYGAPANITRPGKPA